VCEETDAEAWNAIVMSGKFALAAKIVLRRAMIVVRWDAWSVSREADDPGPASHAG
jgi:hypothetical protein